MLQLERNMQYAKHTAGGTELSRQYSTERRQQMFSRTIRLQTTQCSAGSRQQTAVQVAQPGARRKGSRFISLGKCWSIRELILLLCCSPCDFHSCDHRRLSDKSGKDYRRRSHHQLRCLSCACTLHMAERRSGSRCQNQPAAMHALNVYLVLNQLPAESMCPSQDGSSCYIDPHGS